MLHLVLQQTKLKDKFHKIEYDSDSKKKIREYVENEVRYLYGIWKDIIIRFSDKRLDELQPHLQETVKNLIVELQNEKLKFIPTKSLSSQLDEPIIKLILLGCSIINDVSTIDKIYERTKSAMGRYFYDKDIVNTYLGIGEFEKAQKVLQYLLDKNHISYWYRILLYDENDYKSETWLLDFVDFLISIKKKAKAKLLAKGEKLNIGEVSYNDLLELIELIKKIKDHNKTEIVPFFQD